jgi:rSAM/selenodomain-associated transferase 2
VIDRFDTAPLPKYVLTIIVPVLNEATMIVEGLQHLQALRTKGCEIIVVDGGSQDQTTTLALPLADQILQCEKGRACQMNFGAQHAQSDTLLFLHADTYLPDGAAERILTGLTSAKLRWGRFDVEIVGDAWMLGVVAMMMNWRSRVTGIATGDQALFMRRALFDEVGGFPQQVLMEDVEMSRRLRQITPPLCLKQKVKTSGRRWMQRGVWRTIFLMWRLRLLYWLGVAPDELAKEYR